MNLQLKRKILITGANGFLGKFIYRRFKYEDVVTLGLNGNNNIVCDLTKEIPIIKNKYDIVVHAAGSYEGDNIKAINYDGTINLCNSLKDNPPHALVFISTVQVYGKIAGENIDESCELHPITEYGKSKRDAENYLSQWCFEHGVKLTILRPVAIIGTGMKGSLRAFVNMIYRGYYYHIKGNQARRSVVHAVDVADAIEKVASVGGIYNLSDNKHPQINDLADAIAFRLGNKRIGVLSPKLVKFLCCIGDITGGILPVTSKRLSQITETLTFNSDLISTVVDWHPNDVVNYLRTHNYEEDDF